jgi:PPOX class probable F420-dependent enzyme
VSGAGHPRPTAPLIPAAYGVPTDASGADRLPWAWAEERLTEARNYWICTTRADGRPHAAPVWGLWLGGAVWFSTARDSSKGRNLARSPAALVHLESGDETVILEGVVEEVADGAALERFADAYEAKYAFRPDPGEAGSVTYALRPRVAQTWREADYPLTAARWIFD